MIIRNHHNYFVLFPATIETGTVICNNQGYLITHDEAKAGIELLKNHMKNISPKDIEDTNKQIEKEFQEKMASVNRETKELKKQVVSHVYLIKTSSDEYKIGLTANLKSRLKSFEQLDSGVRLIHSLKTYDGYELEKELHGYFKDKHISRELFTLNDDDVKLFKKYKSALVIK